MTVLRNPRQPRGAQTKDEDGAILILALVFILLISFSVLGLLTFGGTGIKDAASLQGQRGLDYAAEGATTAAIQSVRYAATAYNATSGAGASGSDCQPGGVPMPIPEDTVTYTMTVVCSGTFETGPTPQQYTRVISFYSCQTALLNGAACTESNAVVSATVDFQDLSAAGTNGCYAATATDPNSDTSTCGTAMVITSWLVNSALT